MKSIFFFSFLFIAQISLAQDAIVIKEGNFLRGVIKGTNYQTVILQQEDESLLQFEAKNIQSFVWNGETYVSKPILIKKKLENYFFKIIENGAVNLYSMGDKKIAEQTPSARVKVRPTFGVGIGSGGFGGGMGGGISIGGGGGNNNRSSEINTSNGSGKVRYFIEKPGSGPMIEIPLENTATLKTILSQKLNDDDQLIEQLKNSDSISELNLIAFVKAYNSGKK